MRTPFLFRTCKAALQSQVIRLGGTALLPIVRQVCPRRVIDGAAAGRRFRCSTRVTGIQDIPINSTSLPPESPGSSTGQLDDEFVAPLPENWANHDVLMAGCEPGSRLNVAVLLSGGVDSSLALRLLRAAGHTCHAFYLQIWFQEDFRNFWGACPWEEDLQYARQVCESLGVPLEVVPLTTEYWDRVVSGSVEEIRAGRTPNPDMWCNSRVKFGAFYDYLDRTYGAAFDRVASGHYARVERVPRRSSPAVVNSSGGSGSLPELEKRQQERQVHHHHHHNHNHCQDREGHGKNHPDQVKLSAAAASAAASSSVIECNDDEEEEEVAEAARRRRSSHSGASSSGLLPSRQPQQLSAGLCGAANTCAGLDRGGGSDGAGAAGAAGGGGGGGCGEGEGEEVRLLLTPDAVKDQTYFLANLSPRQLSRVMFPLGCLTKSQVRKLAAAADLANKNRKDSQGICFLGKVKFHEFVREHLGEWPGPILEAETGQPLGLHQGYWFYTVGQRGGIKLPGGPWYVVAKDTLRNAVLVSRQYYDADKQRNTFTCGPFNWLDAATRPDPDPRAGPLFVKVRHGPSMYCCELRLHDARGDGSYGNDSYGTVVLAQNDQGLAAGQYAVFYQDGRCLGCAVIQETVDVGGAGRREKTGAPAAVSSKA